MVGNVRVHGLIFNDLKLRNIMTQEEIKFIVKTADNFAKEIWNTKHMSCVGNLSVKLQELVKNLTMHDVSVPKGTVCPCYNTGCYGRSDNNTCKSKSFNCDSRQTAR